ncbi:unnamed protein product [Phytophthora fragariaefolia]|uniref:Unnamed protein product n=1 Tax=Phytophthora fragariaefolia TaxID=1490495 RepID=A0A9W6Y9E7_9STRA|nr:unnamed protein product [Phytophthora fragariaefolia]
MSAQTSVDFEGLCGHFVLRGLELALELNAAAAQVAVRDVAPRLLRWVQRTLHGGHPAVHKAEELPLLQPIAVPLALRSMHEMLEAVEEMKAEMQLQHGLMAEIKANREEDAKLLRLVLHELTRTHDRGAVSAEGAAKAEMGGSSKKGGAAQFPSKQVPAAQRLELPVYVTPAQHLHG